MALLFVIYWGYGGYMRNADIKLINKLIKLSLVILNTTRDLVTKDYQSTLKKLNSLISLENEFYQNINSNTILDYLTYLDYTSEAKILTDYELVVDGKNEDLAKRRIFNKLKYLVKERTIINYQNTYNNKEAKVPIDSKFYLNKSIKEDFINIFIFKLEELINNPKYSLYKNKLIETKYLIRYLNPNLYITTNSKDKLYLNSNSLSSILNINKYYYKYLNSYLHKEFIYNIKPSIISLLLTNNLDYDNYNEIIRILINITLIKSYLVFKNNKNIDINLNFHDIIKLYNKNNRSITILENIINNNQDDNIVMLELRGIYEYESNKGF